MSKKKSFSGSTMTLKDFHGGSIPSDLPLPSAPGVIVRPTDRSSFDRQTPTPAWGSSSVPRSDHRSRPGSSGPIRTFDEKASFLSVPHIGRNFDEDERKPFDGGVTRRPVGEDSAAPPVVRLDPMPVAARQVSTAPVPAMMKPVAGPNAWAARREAVEPPPPPPPGAGTASAGSAQSVVSKLAHASAVEKVSSGRWQSKPVPIYHHPPDVEVIRYAEMEPDVDVGFSISRMEGGSELDAARGKYGERAASPMYSDAKERLHPEAKDGMHYPETRERMYQEAKERMYPDVKDRVYPELKERSSGFYSDGNRPASRDGRLAGGPQSQAVAEVPERPKLKLLPRTKPMEPAETHVVDYKQVNQPPAADLVLAESGHEYSGNMNSPKSGSAGGEGGSRAAERPKLNLKPRSQPLEQMDGILERERNTLFGGARPRELVLKERGVDDLVINNLDVSQPTNRVKHEGSKPDVKPDPSHPATRTNERPDNLPSDQRTARHFERKDHHLDAEKMDVQRSLWRNDNRRNGKETDKSQERRPEPESWRKPLEPPKQATPEVSGPRFGRAVSAVDLAQAFSRSMSDAKSDDRLPSQRGLPGRNQVPFSRLTDIRDFYSGPATRQINGY